MDIYLSFARRNEMERRNVGIKILRFQDSEVPLYTKAVSLCHLTVVGEDTQSRKSYLA
jgi:hypothetical protein